MSDNSELVPMCWFVMDGTTIDPVVDAVAAGIDIPADVLAWAEQHGVNQDNPDYWIAAGWPESMAATGEVAWMFGGVSRADADVMLRELDREGEDQ